MKIYISGPITGIENFREKFEAAENLLIEQGIDVVNPVKVDTILPESLTYEDHMKVDLALLDICDGIYMMNGWEKSLGANREYGYALARGMKVCYEKED